LLKEAWTLAIETLSWMQMQKLNEHLALARTVRQLDISNADTARLAHRLVSETVRRQNLIDKFINYALKPSKLAEFDLGVQAFLRLYVYHMRVAKNWMKVDVKEAEHMARLARSILGWKALQEVEPFLGFMLTQKLSLIFQDVGDEERIGLQTFHPTWFVKYCNRLFGRTETIAMLEANTQEPPTYIRLNTLKQNAEEVLGKLTEDGIKTEKIDRLKYVFRILGSKQPLVRTPSYRDGLFYVQDKSSCLAVEAANPQSGMTVIDVCAAPGAKTTYLAQLMRNKGVIYSLDFSRRRMSVWKAENARMGVEIAEPITADARYPLPIAMQADVLVLDPPCTSTGTFGKSPSDKWRLTGRSIENMAELQWQMLNNCAENVKQGGTLIYSTSSITVEENENQIERFLKWHLRFSLEEISPKMGSPGLRGLEKCQRLYPHIHKCNGFFIAKLVKNKV
jgi:16S rRNA (cytosine967-C5)-methyltransferase